MKYIHNVGTLKETKKLGIIGIAIAFAAAAALAMFSPAQAAKVDKSTTIQGGLIVDSSGDKVVTGYNDWGYNYQAHMFNGKYCDSYRDASWCQPYADDNLIMKWNDAWLSNKDMDEDRLLDRHYGHDSYRGSGAWLTNHQSGEYEEAVGWDVSGEYTFEIPYSSRTFSYNVVLTQELDTVTGTLIDTYLGSAYPNKDLPVVGTVSGNDITLEVTYPGDYWGTRSFEGTIASDGIITGTWEDSGSGNGQGSWATSEGTANHVYETQYWNYFVKIVAAPTEAEDKNGVWMLDDVEIGPVIWDEFAVVQEVYNDTGTGEHGVSYKSMVNPGLGFWQNQE